MANNEQTLQAARDDLRRYRHQDIFAGLDLRHPRATIRLAERLIGEEARRMLGETPRDLQREYEFEEDFEGFDTPYSGLSHHDIIDKRGLDWKLRIAELRTANHYLSDDDRAAVDGIARKMERDRLELGAAGLCERAAVRVLQGLRDGDARYAAHTGETRDDLARAVEKLRERAGAEVRDHTRELEDSHSVAHYLNDDRAVLGDRLRDELLPALLGSRYRSGEHIPRQRVEVPARVRFEMQQPDDTSIQDLQRDLAADEPGDAAKNYAQATFSRNFDALLGGADENSPEYLDRFERIRVGGESVWELCADKIEQEGMNAHDAVRYMMCFVAAKALQRDKPIAVETPSGPGRRPALVPLTPEVQTNEKRPGWFKRVLNKLGLYRSEFLSEQQKRRQYDRTLAQAEPQFRERSAQLYRDDLQRELLDTMADITAAHNDHRAFFHPNDLHACNDAVKSDDPKMYFKPEQVNGIPSMDREPTRCNLARLYMYSQGYGLDEIYSDDPHALAAKRACGKQLYNTLHSGTPEQVADLYAGIMRVFKEHPFPKVDPQDDASIVAHYREMDFLSSGAQDLEQTMGQPGSSALAAMAHQKLGAEAESYVQAVNNAYVFGNTLCRSRGDYIAADVNHSTANRERQDALGITPQDKLHDGMASRLMGSVLAPGAYAAAGMPLGSCATRYGYATTVVEIGAAMRGVAGESFARPYANGEIDVNLLRDSTDTYLSQAMGTSLQQLTDDFAKQPQPARQALDLASMERLNGNQPSPRTLTRPDASPSGPSTPSLGH